MGWGAIFLLVSAAHAGLTIDASPTPAPAPTEEPYDFTNEVVFVQVVTATKNGCSVASPTYSLPGACVLNPYRELCEANRPRIRARLRQTYEGALALNAEADRVYQRLVPQAEREVGPLAAHGTDRAFIGRYLSYLYDRTSEEVSRPTRPQVERVLDDVKRTFLEAVRKSGVFSPSLMRDVNAIVDRCTRHPRLSVEPFSLLSRNAVCWRGTNPAAFGERIEDHDGEKVRVIQESYGECHVNLTGPMWLECSRGSPSCYQTLFHELGHALNSCRFYVMSWQAQAALATADTHVSERFSDSYREFLAATRGTARRIAQGIQGMSACLNDVSGSARPQNSIPNACPMPGLPANDVLRTRCDVGTVEGYPSQWEEAEADFWGATATAEHFSHGIYEHDPARVRSDFGEALGAWCANELEPPAYGEIALSSARQKFANRAYLNAPFPPIPSPRPCENQPAPGYARPSDERDSHQSWEARFNHNYLRHQGLRRVLGCESAPQPEVLSTCDARGTTRTRLPLPAH